jgi:hypothetical protein
MADGQVPHAKRRPLHFPETPKTGKGAEGRAAPRHLVSKITSCRMIRLPEPMAIEAKLRDVSLTGVGIYSPAWLDPGTFLMITIQGWQGAERTLRAKVIHATRIDKGNWLLGCLLDNALTWPEVEDLL